MANRKTQRTGKSTTRGSARLEMSRRPASRPSREPEFGGMTVREAGRKGGLIGGRKGGLAVKAERGREFYQEIGRKGGQRVRDLIAAGKKTEERALPGTGGGRRPQHGIEERTPARRRQS
jgi:general stress protein YciG